MRKYRVELKWGLVFFVALLGWMLVERLAGFHGERIEWHAAFTSLFALVAVTLYVIAFREKRRTLPGGSMNWREGFLTGVRLTAVVTLLSPLGQIIIHRFISPGFFQNMIQYVVATERMTREAAEAYFNLSSYILQSVVGALVMGVATSAVVAWFLSRRSQATPGQTGGRID